MVYPFSKFRENTLIIFRLILLGIRQTDNGGETKQYACHK